jgi:ketosteroid isomerase-like protein
MKLLYTIALTAIFAGSLLGQSAEQKIYDTERAFQAAAAEKGINAAFIQYLTKHAVMFMPGPVNAHEAYAKRTDSTGSLTWNPEVIRVSGNGVLGYSIGNSEYRAKGPNDADVAYGHYLSIWLRQPDGEYRAVLDAGVHHPKPTTVESVWTGTAAAKPSTGPASAGDASVAFYTAAERNGSTKAYGSFLADDAIVLRKGEQPFRGRKAAVSFLEKQKKQINFARRKSFIEAGDLAYVYADYTMTGRDSGQTEKGSFVQVWRLIDGKWKIAADVLLPLPAEQK